MIRDPLINQKARGIYIGYLLSFSMDDIIDYEVLSFDDWVKNDSVFKNYWEEN